MPNHTLQVCTFPYALFSSPQFNAHAYTIEIDSGAHSKPNHFAVWSPVHYPHHVGRYKTREAAQKKADEINALGPLVYSPVDNEQAFDYIDRLQKHKKGAPRP